MFIFTAQELRQAIEPLDLIEATRGTRVDQSRSRVCTTFSLLDLPTSRIGLRALHARGVR